MAGTDFSRLTNDELIKGIQALKLPDYIRSKAYGVDVRETLAQMTEMTIQLGVNMGLSPDDALEMVKKLQDIDAQKAAKTDVVAFNNRIDNIIANAGDGTIPTELLDIRAGKKGKTYTTARERIDTEIGLVGDSVSRIMEEKLIVDDTNADITYEGVWNQGDGPDYNNSNHTSNRPGDYIEYAFIGTGIEVYDRMTTSRGIVEVFLDGVSQGTFDRYESRTRYSQLMFKKFNLEYGVHIIKILITDQKNASSSGTSFAFDYLTVHSQLINDLKGKITKNLDAGSFKQFKQVVDKSMNLYDYQASTDDFYISKGALIPQEFMNTSDFIEIEPGQYIKSQTDTANEISLFDENKKFIMGITATNGIFNIPNDITIKYLRFFINTGRIGKKHIMLVKGSALPTEFIPFSEEKFTLKGLVIEGNQNKSYEKEFVPYPYQSKRLNPPKPLFIPTYNTDGDHAIHPKVLYFPEKWNGYKFWMTFTPYTKTNEVIENPSIAVSNNGIDWGIPEGLTNPLDIPVDTARTHNSDPHLVYNHDTDTLECWWRFSTKPSQPELFERVYRRTTTDGINWTPKELLKESLDTVTGLQSPAVNYEDGKYKIWYSHSINLDRSRRIVKYEESIDGTNWQFVRDIVLAQDDEGPLQVLNHLDVVKVNGVYKMVGSKSYQGSTGLTYMTSTDNVTYTEPVEVLKRGHPDSWDGVQCYRPSITIVDGHEYLYYCGRDKNSNWGTGLIIVDDIGNMREYGGLT